MSDTNLVIEDDVTFRKLLQMILTRQGFRVELADNAATGLRKAYALRPNLIILDVSLPDMDGCRSVHYSGRCLTYRSLC